MLKRSVIYLIIAICCDNLINGEKFKTCCQNMNIMINESCSDGSDPVQLSCDARLLVGPTKNPPMSLKTDNSYNLIVTDIEGGGYLILKPDRYCITKDKENGPYLALICVETQNS